MQSPRTLKEMQSLSEKLAALNRFLSRSAERALPFFETLKNITKENKDDYRWTKEAEQAFQELKKLIIELQTLITPEPKETLYVYLATSCDAVSGVLVADGKGEANTNLRFRLYLFCEVVNLHDELKLAGTFWKRSSNVKTPLERRETTTIREAKYKKKVEQYYNKQVRLVSFKVRDFVYRRNESSRVKNKGKLGKNMRVVNVHSDSPKSH
nr:reverse transcriptase domain-containing protein [Tanacetum cinerariifolium]